MFGSLDNVQTPDDMGAGRRKRFCDEWFGRKQGGRKQQQLYQYDSYSGASGGMRGVQSQRSVPFASAGGGGPLTYGSAGDSFVLMGKDRRREEVHERSSGKRKRSREVVRSDGEDGEDAKMSQVLLEEIASPESSVTG